MRRHAKASSSTFRNRFGIAGLISTIALVFAMTGGAFAAKYLITSAKQISPSVLKKLKGATGPAGAAGANGAQGPAGPAGAAGANGEKGAAGAAGKDGALGKDGTNGTNGKSVKVKAATEFDCEELGGAIVEEEGGSPVEVCTGKTGKEGKEGKEGSPWSANSTLPVGLSPPATETGAFVLSGNTGPGSYTAISFPIKLAGNLSGEHVHYMPFGAEPTATCPALNHLSPSATSGELCVYEQVNINATPEEGVVFNLGNSATGSNRTGALLKFNMGTGGFVSGTFAVAG